LSIESSFQDNFSTQVAIRNQFTPRLNSGFEVLTGLPKYRFVGTKVMREGYTFSLSIPNSFLIQQQEKIELYGVGRIGARFQGIIDPDNNDLRDSTLTGTALMGELGVMTSLRLPKRLICKRV